jgi:hypothetical protein
MGGRVGGIRGGGRRLQGLQQRPSSPCATSDRPNGRGSGEPASDGSSGSCGRTAEGLAQEGSKPSPLLSHAPPLPGATRRPRSRPSRRRSASATRRQRPCSSRCAHSSGARRSRARRGSGTRSQQQSHQRARVPLATAAATVAQATLTRPGPRPSPSPLPRRRPQKVGRRLSRAGFEINNRAGQFEQRKAFQRLIYLSYAVFGEQKATFLLPWRRVFNLNDSQLFVARRDNARAIFGQHLREKSGGDLPADRCGAARGGAGPVGVGGRRGPPSQLQRGGLRPGMRAAGGRRQRLEALNPTPHRRPRRLKTPPPGPRCASCGTTRRASS